MGFPLSNASNLCIIRVVEAAFMDSTLAKEWIADVSVEKKLDSINQPVAIFENFLYTIHGVSLLASGMVFGNSIIP